MRALVTGGAGFIASHVADALLDAGHEVRVLDNLFSGSRRVVPEGAEFIDGDVSEEETVARAVDGVEVVFHQAAHRAVARSVDDPCASDRANTYGTLVLLDRAVEAGVRRMVAASSSSVYGGAETLPTPESETLVPRSPYAVSKLAGEHYCRVFYELHGLETVSLRYFNVYGPRQSPDSAYAAVIPLFIDALEHGKAPEVHGDGHQSRDFTYVEDVVAANLLAASAPAEAVAGKSFNVAGGQAFSVLEVGEALSEILGVEWEPTFGAPRPGDVRHSLADLTAARRDLGYEPRVDFKQGLEHTVAWFTS